MSELAGNFMWKETYLLSSMEIRSICRSSRRLCRGEETGRIGKRSRPLEPQSPDLIGSFFPLFTSMATPPLTGSLSSPLVTAMADASIRYMDCAAFDLFVIEMVNTLRVSSAHAQARALRVKQGMIDAGLLPTPQPTPGTRRDTRGSVMSLSSNVTTKAGDEEEGLKLRLEAIGIHVGANITGR